jgi:hypothetical protein
LFVVVVLLAQLQLLSYDAAAAIPSPADSAAGRSLLEKLRTSPAPVWLISSGFYGYLAQGAPVTVHAMGFTDVFKSRRETAKRNMRAEISAAIRQRRFATIVLDGKGGFLPPDILHEIRATYRLRERIFSRKEHAFYPKVGASVRPEEIWIAR